MLRMDTLNLYGEEMAGCVHSSAIRNQASAHIRLDHWDGTVSGPLKADTHLSSSFSSL